MISEASSQSASRVLPSTNAPPIQSAPGQCVPDSYPAQYDPEWVARSGRDHTQRRRPRDERHDSQSKGHPALIERVGDRGGEHQTDERGNEHDDPYKPGANIEIVRNPGHADPASPDAPKQRKRLKRSAPA